jgi:nicotinic acid mononucleotide adenylyltransferase
MLEKYHYLTFLKRCKKILDDGQVTDDEIDSLKSVDDARSEARVVGEALDKNNTLVFAFGRFNPPTVGHAKLMSKVITEARSNRANHIVYASASTDKRSNPLDVNTKVKFMKKMFPKNNIKAASGNERTFIEILKFFDKMYGNIIMIAGSDRVGEFQKLTNKYNGQEYNYKTIKLVSSGERDPDAEGVTGMSASKMREMAKNNDYRNFKTGVSNLSDKDSKALFNAVKKGMGISERYENFTNYLNNDIREEYHQERLFNVGDMIEHMDGTNGMIVRRGSNYVSYETEEGLIKKAWLYDIQEGPRIPRKKGQPAGSDKHSDLYTDENPKGTIKGLGFKDVETAKASVSKIKNSGKTHAHKIQAAVAMEQRAREMGKTSEAAVYRKYINQMKEITKKKNESLIDTLEREMDMSERYLIGTDEYAQHTMKMTPGQPIQNFRKVTDKITKKDIEKFKNEDETIDKYKKRFKENWKSELDKAVEKMREQL